MTKKKLSKKGYQIIENWETFRSKPYRDSVGVVTVGFGHTRTATMDMQPITLQQAVELLKSDVFITESYVNAHFPKLRQCQFDAVVSLLFNIGFGKFQSTKLHKLLETDPDSKHVADEWVEFRNAGGKYLRGLLRRRLDELSLYYSW